MKKLLTLVVALSCVISCTDDERSMRVLEQAGYMAISTTGYKFLMCGRDYDYSTGFIALNNRARRVKGAVCCNTRSCTIMYE